MRAMEPRPPVEIMTRKRPTMMVFFVPSQFLISELNGENITWATEKLAKIILISFSESDVSSSFTTVQSFVSTKSGKNALRLETIIFPIKITTMTAYKVFFFISGVNPSSNSDYISSRSNMFSRIARL